MSNPKATTRTSRSNVWEHPCELPEEEEAREPSIDKGKGLGETQGDEEGFNEEDPLFRDEDEENSTVSMEGLQEEKKPRNKVLWVVGSILLVGTLVFLAVVIAWIVDLKKVKPRVEADPLKFISLGELSVDVTQPRPELSVEVKIKETAFPKYSFLEPTGADCILYFYELPFTATFTPLEKTQEDGAGDGIAAKNFLLEVEFPDDQHKIGGWADFTWASLTRKRTYWGPWQCEMHFHVKMGGWLSFHTTKIERGRLDFGSAEEALPRPPSLIYQSHGPTMESSSASLAWMQQDEDANDQAANLPYYSIHDTVDPSIPPTTIAPSTMAPVDNQTSPEFDLHTPPGNEAILQVPGNVPPQDGLIQPGMVVVRSLSVDRVDLGVRLPALPSAVFEVVSKIHVKIPPVQIEVATPQNIQQAAAGQANRGSRQVVRLNEFNVTLEDQQEEQYASLQISCGKGDTTCPWFNPLVDTVSTTLSPDHAQKDDKLVLKVTMDADQSFLETMMGHEHNVVIYRYQLPRFDSDGQRQLEQGGGPIMDCVVAKDALLGDVLSLSACIDIRPSDGIYFNADAQFYSFSGMALADIVWKREGDVFSLETNARMAFDTDNTNRDNSDQPKFNISGAAILDLDQSSVDIQISNTAEWWPSRALLQGMWEGDGYDELLKVSLSNAILEVKDESYAKATGLFTLDLIGETMSLTLNDPRLEVAIDGLVESEYPESKAAATWKVVFEDEDINVGESSLTLTESGYRDLRGVVQSSSEGRLRTSVQGEFDRSDVFFVKLHDARMHWDDDMFADMLGSVTLDDNGVSMDLSERTNDHSIDFSFGDVYCDGDCLSLRGTTNARLSGRNIYTCDFVMDAVNNSPEYDQGTVTAGMRGAVDQYPYAASVDADWAYDTGSDEAYRVRWSDFSLDFDGRDIMSMSGQFRVPDNYNQPKSVGELSCFTGPTSEVTLLVDGDCEWHKTRETLTCTVKDLGFGVSGTEYVDAKGDMTLNVPAQNMVLTINDDYKSQDKNGFDIEMSGLIIGDIVTADLRQLKVVWEDETMMDANGQITLNGEDISMGMQAEDTVSDSAFGVERAALDVQVNDYDEVDSIGVNMEKMTAKVNGEAWMDGRARSALDMVASTISFSMINNTTKLPMDIDLVISFDSDKGVDGLATLVPYVESDGYGLAFRNETEPSGAITYATNLTLIGAGAECNPNAEGTTYYTITLENAQSLTVAELIDAFIGADKALEKDACAPVVVTVSVVERGQAARRQLQSNATSGPETVTFEVKALVDPVVSPVEEFSLYGGAEGDASFTNAFREHEIIVESGAVVVEGGDAPAQPGPAILILDPPTPAPSSARQSCFVSLAVSLAMLVSAAVVALPW
ncbi:expressed unknown protein [Seminavis robusta]|uniref:Uncharacterized protein n=1 Tax=Seminavis robusta TaxID=568900 RepID=A0A9N8DUM4_9STRA|nr:expressed unknown protein [Seminavis robusta]|eukprot:Sro293_g110000.1 n/a (1364) ;mRNA; r:52893-56984